MEKFMTLTDEKRNSIIDAALKSFAANGYKKTSASDIASAAGISKALIFHYFGTKKALYLYLIEYCYNIVLAEVTSNFDHTQTDFFERIKTATNIKVSVMKVHPDIMAFLTNVFLETDEEVKADIEAIFSRSYDIRNKIAFEGMDVSKFKDNVNPKAVINLLTLMAEGYGSTFSKTEFNLDQVTQEFFECLDMLKNNLYKECYL